MKGASERERVWCPDGTTPHPASQATARSSDQGEGRCRGGACVGRSATGRMHVIITRSRICRIEGDKVEMEMEFGVLSGKAMFGARAAPTISRGCYPLL
jgi:hypothetical protein